MRFILTMIILGIGSSMAFANEPDKNNERKSKEYEFKCDFERNSKKGGRQECKVWGEICVESDRKGPSDLTNERGCEERDNELNVRCEGGFHFKADGRDVEVDDKRDDLIIKAKDDGRRGDDEKVLIKVEDFENDRHDATVVNRDGEKEFDAELFVLDGKRTRYWGECEFEKKDRHD